MPITQHLVPLLIKIASRRNKYLITERKEAVLRKESRYSLAAVVQESK
jgi:hypothetical protein